MQQPAASVLGRAAEVIGEQREKMFAQVATAVDGRDPEGVHDMRVATRRLRACLTTFAPWLDEAEQTRIAQAARELTRALGRVRELDVLRLRLTGLAAEAAPERALAIEHVDAHLGRRWRRARERMMSRFAKVGIDRLESRLRRLVTHVEHGAGERRSATSGVHAREQSANGGVGRDHAMHDAPIAALLEAMAGTLLAEAREVSEPTIPARSGTPEAAAALHAVRIAAKKLRYQLEVVEPYLGARGTDAVKRLKTLQEKLGDFHDDTVLDETLRAEIERASERERPRLAAELRRLRSARRRVLTRDERAVRTAIVRLREQGFVELVADALRDAGVPLPVEEPVAGDGAASGARAAVAGSTGEVSS